MGLKNSNEAIMHAAKVVKLDNHLSDNVNSFSGGMKRRLSLAIALPSVGIDPALRQQIWQELHELSKQGQQF